MTETQPGAAGEDQQPTLREDAMYAMGYQRGVKAGWNLCIEDDQEGFARTQASTEHVRVLLDSRCAPPAAAPAVQTELTDERLMEVFSKLDARSEGDATTLRIDAEGGYVDALDLIGARHAWRAFEKAARSIEREVRSLLSGTRTCVQAGDSQTQEIAHLAASQASRTSGDAATNAPSAAGSDSAAGVMASGEANNNATPPEPAEPGDWRPLREPGNTIEHPDPYCGHMKRGVRKAHCARCMRAAYPGVPFEEAARRFSDTSGVALPAPMHPDCTAPDCDCEPGIECAARGAARGVKEGHRG